MLQSAVCLDQNNFLFSNMNKLPKQPLNLKQFLLRQEVIKLYRDIFRAIRLVPDKNGQEQLKEWARYDFRNNKNQADEVAIKMLIHHGRRSLTELQTSLELSGNFKKKS